MFIILLFLSFLYPQTTFAHQTNANKLTIYTYNSFTASYGPGPLIKKNFEKKCSCELVFISAGDSLELLNRIRLEKNHFQGDIVLGFDLNVLEEAKKTNIFAPHDIDTSNINLPIDWKDDVFVPFDYSYFAIMYNKKIQINPPKSLQELVESDNPEFKIIIQDPRTSTTGLSFLLWIRKIYGDKAPQAWEKLKKKILTVTPGWSESYNLFVKGEAPLTFSYITSRAYHHIVEKTDQYQEIYFPEGHYIQIEVAGITKKGAQNPLSKKFIDFMISPEFQDVISETNWMFPVGKTLRPLHPIFNEIKKPEIQLFFLPQELSQKRKAWVEEWLSVMRK